MLKSGKLKLALIASALLPAQVLAVSPPHPQGYNQNMITANQFDANSYQPQDSSKMFPAPKEGMVQHILTLPQLENEDDYMIEIQVGQTQMVDCNKHGLMGELKQMDLKGWGYTYWELDEIGPGRSTMMACFDKAKHEEFVRIPGEYKLRYNSKLPMVIYLPENAELRYRVWRADTVFNYSK